MTFPVTAAKAARSAAPFPRFRGWQITISTDEETFSKIVLVPSLEQSSTTIISICLIGDCRTALTTRSIVWPSLKHGTTIETFIVWLQRCTGSKIPARFSEPVTMTAHNNKRLQFVDAPKER